MTDGATRDDPPDYSGLGEGPLDACHRGGTFRHMIVRRARRSKDAGKHRGSGSLYSGTCRVRASWAFWSEVRAERDEKRRDVGQGGFECAGAGR